MTLPIDNSTILGSFIPNVYISRVVLSYGNKVTKIRGDNPHIDIPTSEQFASSWSNTEIFGEGWWGGLKYKTQEGMEADQEMNYKMRYAGLYGSEKKKTDISTYSNIDPAVNNSPLIVRLDLVVHDVVENQLLSSWFNTEKISKYLNLQIVQSTDAQQTAAVDALETQEFGGLGALVMAAGGSLSVTHINIGDVLPFNGEGDTIAAIDSNTGLPLSITKYNSNRLNSYEFTTNDLGQRVYNITFSATFEVPKPNVNHLSYFARIRVDKKFFEDSFSPSLDLGSTEDTWNLLTGKRVLEMVIKNGETINNASYYVDTKNKVWLGPVHLMYKTSAGAVGAPSYISHHQLGDLRPDQMKNVAAVVVKGNIVNPNVIPADILTEVKTTNTKIQDFRQRNALDKVVIDFSEANTLFSVKKLTREQFTKEKMSMNVSFISPLWMTTDTKNRANFCFAVDARNLLLHYSPYGRLWLSLTKEQQHWIVTNNLLKNVSIVRKRVKSMDDDTLFDNSIPLEVVAYLDDEKLATGKLSKLALQSGNGDFDYNYCFFAGCDESITNVSDGYYQYGIRFSFEDKLLSLINNKISNLQLALKKAKHLYTISRLPKYYNLISDVYTKAYAKEMSDEFLGIVPDMLSSFDELYSIVAQDKFTKKDGFLTNLLNICAPQTGTPDGLEFIIGMVESFLDKVTNIFSSQGLTTNSDSNNYNPSGVKTSKANKFLNGEFYFKEMFDATKRNEGYDFLFLDGRADPPDELGIKQLFYGHLQERTTKENLKYFTDEAAIIPLQVGDDIDKKPLLTNLIDQKYTYLSPSKAHLPEGGITFLLPGNKASKAIDYKRTNNIYLEITKEYFTGKNSGLKVEPKEVTNLTPQDKKQKLFLTDILAAKGGSYVSSVTEGVSLYALVPPLKQNLNYDKFGTKETMPIFSQQEEDSIPPEMVDEPNYNDALMFLTDPDNSTNINTSFAHFKSFIDTLATQEAPFVPALKQGPPSPVLTQEDLKNIPNHYKQLIALRNVKNVDANNYQIDNVINLDLIKDNLKLNDVTAQGGIFEDLAVKQKFFGIFMHYFNLVKIEYLSAFNGVKMPIFAPLNNVSFSKIKEGKREVLCRMRYYANEKLGVFRDAKLDLPIYDQYFILCETKPPKAPVYKGANNKIKKFAEIAKHVRALEDVRPEYSNLQQAKEVLKKKAEAKAKAAKKIGTWAQKKKQAKDEAMEKAGKKIAKWKKKKKENKFKAAKKIAKWKKKK